MNRPRHKTKTPGVMYRESAAGGRLYIVLFTDANGKQRTKTLPLGATLEDAKAYRGTLHARKLDGDSLVPSRQTVGDLLDDYMEYRRHNLSAQTQKVYTVAIEKHLKPAIGHKRITDLSPSDVASFISVLKSEGKKTWTVRKYLNPLRGAFQLAVRDGKVSSSPVTKLLAHEKPSEDQAEKRCLSPEEIQVFLRACSSGQWKALMSTLIFCGLRISEALALTWNDISDEAISVRGGKTKAARREVILAPSLKRILSAWKLEQAPGTTRVFPASYDGTRRAIRASCERAAIPRYTLHELRHTFASILISQGRTLPFIAEQMGHKDPAITLKAYAHLFNPKEERERAITDLQEAMGGLL